MLAVFAAAGAPGWKGRGGAEYAGTKDAVGDESTLRQRSIDGRKASAD